MYYSYYRTCTLPVAVECTTIDPSRSNAHTVVMQSCEWSRSQQCGMNPLFRDSLQSLTVILRLTGLHHVRVAGAAPPVQQVLAYGALIVRPPIDVPPESHSSYVLPVHMPRPPRLCYTYYKYTCPGLVLTIRLPQPRYVCPALWYVGSILVDVALVLVIVPYR